MKKYNRLVVIFLIAVFGLIGIATQAGSPYNIWERPTGDWLSGGYPNTDPAWAWMKWMDNQIAGAMAGTALFVDSANGSNDNLGTSWNYAYETIQKAVTNVVDYGAIYVAGGSYDETVTTVAGVDHVRLIGVAGSKQIPYWSNATPTVTTSAHLHINGAGWLVKGFRFHHGSTSAAPSIVLDGEAGASGCNIIDNYFTSSGSATLSGGIEMRWYAFDHRIIGNEFFNLTDTGHSGQGGAIYNCGKTQAGLPGSGATGLVIEDNRFYHNKICIGISGAFCEYRGNVFSGMQQDDDQQTTQYIKITHMTSPDGDQPSEGSNIVVGNYFSDHFSWEIHSGNGYFFNDTDSISGNYCKDGIMGRGGPSTAQSDAADAQLVPGRTYAMSILDVSAGNENLFDVDGGPIMITSLTGIITTVISSATCTMTVVLNADTGLDYEFSSGTDIQDWADGSRIVFADANPATITQIDIGDIKGSSNQMSPWFCDAGMIHLTDDDGTATGAISWYMVFIPLIEGVSVTPQ